MPKQYPYHYYLWYVAEMQFDEFTWKGKPVEFDKARTEFREDIQGHIEVFGLQSPIYAQLQKGELRVRRGNNRITALRNLGWTTCPTFIVDYDMRSRHPDWELLGYDRDALQARFFERGNCILQVTRRSASVVTPHMPRGSRGTEYAREVAQR